MIRNTATSVWLPRWASGDQAQVTSVESHSPYPSMAPIAQYQMAVTRKSRWAHPPRPTSRAEIMVMES